MTPFQLNQWSSSNIPGIAFDYCSTEEYDLEKGFLKHGCNCQTIPGTRRLHCFIPQSQDTVVQMIFRLQYISTSEVNKFSADMELEEVTGHLTCIHRSQRWVAQVLNRDVEKGELKLNLLFLQMDPVDGIIVPLPNTLHLAITDILTIVKLHTTTGRSYSLSRGESNRPLLISFKRGEQQVTLTLFQEGRATGRS